ncbi:unnamed protein product [Blepharisma stoltei]|uniref:Uncharacterized protein n=1 Tax=Blepharisma stoltei TaxID=1481888 RepID=A0AAU9ICZ7_9CILI|nr:unnamed protein product [Blepharisma stoltei]
MEQYVNWLAQVYPGDGFSYWGNWTRSWKGFFPEFTRCFLAKQENLSRAIIDLSPCPFYLKLIRYLIVCYFYGRRPIWCQQGDIII